MALCYDTEGTVESYRVQCSKLQMALWYDTEETVVVTKYTVVSYRALK